jgi:RNA recognition motif-containing protein
VPLTLNGKPKGWAIVDFNDDAVAQQAISALTGHEMQGRKLKVFLKYKKKLPP